MESNIGVFKEALLAFKEPEKQLKNAKNFTIHSDPLIEDYFKFVASQGRPEFEWSVIRSAFLWKIKTVINDMKAIQLDESTKENHEDMKKLDKMIEFILLRAQKFQGAPFTIQRICELLISPNRHYNSLGKFLRAIEKTVNIISCIEPTSERITGNLVVEPSDDNEDVRVECSFIVRVDELEMDKPLPSKDSAAKHIVRQHNYFSSNKSDSNDQFATPELSPKLNVDLNDIVTHALPIGPALPSKTDSLNEEMNSDDKA